VGQITNFYGSLQQHRPNSAAHHSLPFMTENWESCWETSVSTVTECWHCTKIC